jgi:HK97 gp10 family phage protein
MIEFELKGFAELQRRLQELPKKLQRSVMAGAVKEASGIVQRAAKENAPIAAKDIYRKAIHKTGKKAGQGYKAKLAPGTLKKSIGIRQKRKGVQQGEVVFQIGPSKKAFYGQFVEKGHVLRKKRKGPVIGHVPAYPFLRPAIEQNVHQAVEIMRKRIAEGLDRIVAGGI